MRGRERGGGGGGCVEYGPGMLQLHSTRQTEISGACSVGGPSRQPEYHRHSAIDGKGKRQRDTERGVTESEERARERECM